MILRILQGFFPTYRLRMGQLRSFLLTGAKASSEYSESYGSWGSKGPGRGPNATFPRLKEGPDSQPFFWGQWWLMFRHSSCECGGFKRIDLQFRKDGNGISMFFFHKCDSYFVFNIGHQFTRTRVFVCLLKTHRCSISSFEKPSKFHSTQGSDGNYPGIESESSFFKHQHQLVGT